MASTIVQRSSKASRDDSSVNNTERSIDDLTDDEILAFSPEKQGSDYHAYPWYLHWPAWLIRFIGGWTYSLIVVGLIWMSVFFIGWWAHPLLRLFGVTDRYMPNNYLTQFWAWSSIRMGGIVVETEGAENVDHRKGAVLVSNHCSGLDSIALIGHSPTAVKFIMKQELLYMNPFIFGLAWVTGHIPINRGNHEKAIASIDAAAERLNRTKCTVAIYPEGTRSKNGRLQSFKKGGFHLALKSGIPIIPVRISGSFYVWGPDMMWPVHGTMKITYLPQVKVTKDMTVDELLIKVRRVLLKSIHEDRYRCQTVPIVAAAIYPALWLIFLGVVYNYYF